MKAYQDHDPVLDKGKAVPHPKQPTRHTYRGRGLHGRFDIERGQYREIQTSESERRAKAGRNVHVGVLGVFVAMAALIRGGRR